MKGATNKKESIRFSILEECKRAQYLTFYMIQWILFLFLRLSFRKIEWENVLIQGLLVWAKIGFQLFEWEMY